MSRTNTELQRFVDEIESIESDVKDRNEQKSAVYKAAKAKNYDVKALKDVVAIRRRRRQEGGAGKLEEHDRKVDEYLGQLD